MFISTVRSYESWWGDLLCAPCCKVLPLQALALNINCAIRGKHHGAEWLIRHWGNTEVCYCCKVSAVFCKFILRRLFCINRKKTHQTEPPAWPSPLRFTAAWWSIGDDARKDFCLIECVGTFNEICPEQHLPAGILHGETARHNVGRQSCLLPISYQTDEPVTEMRTAQHPSDGSSLYIASWSDSRT